MATQHQQRQCVVRTGWLVGVSGGREQFLRRDPRGKLLLPVLAGSVAAQLVDQLAGRDPDQPAGWAVRHPFAGPLLRCGEQRLPHRVLGGLEVPVVPYQRGEDPRRQLAQQALDVRAGHISWPDMSMIGRTSTPVNRASGNRDAISAAGSGLSQSTTKYPASCSFASR